MNSISRRQRTFLLAAGLSILAGRSTQASVIQGTILGQFSNVIVKGNVQNDPSLGQQTYLDNTGTAVYSVNNSTDPTIVNGVQSTGSALTWGALSGSSGPTTFSTLDFFGAQIPANYHQPFQLGTITFSNGTSDLNSLIFAATLSFYDNTVSQSTFLGSDQVIITTTSNLGASLAQDADYINICGSTSGICNLSIEAYEASQGGTGVTAYLMGTIVGDPMLALNNVVLAPNQGTGGFIGNDPPIGTLPEPATMLLVPAALFGIGLYRVSKLRMSPGSRRAIG